MKKLLSLILALVMCLSLCACGSDKGKDNTNNTGKNPEATTMSKEDMLAAAEVVTPSQITQDTNSNIAKAKQLYCGKVLEVTGVVAAVKENYVEIGVDTSVAGAVIDVYLPTEELLLLESRQKVTIVGKTNDVTSETTSSGPMGMEWVKTHYTMPEAYLVNDTFEVSGKLFGKNQSYAPAYNFDDGTSVTKLLYFADGVDLSVIGSGATFTVKGKIYLGSINDTDFVIRDAIIVE